jgi:hypothetical protein
VPRRVPAQRLNHIRRYIIITDTDDEMNVKCPNMHGRLSLHTGVLSGRSAAWLDTATESVAVLSESEQRALDQLSVTFGRSNAGVGGCDGGGCGVGQAARCAAVRLPNLRGPVQLSGDGARLLRTNPGVDSTV